MFHLSREHIKSKLESLCIYHEHFLNILAAYAIQLKKNAGEKQYYIVSTIAGLVVMTEKFRLEIQGSGY